MKGELIKKRRARDKEKNMSSRQEANPCHYLSKVGTQNFSRNMRSEFTKSEKKKHFTSVIMTSSFKSHYKTISGRQVYKGMDIFRMYKKSVSRIQGHKKVRNVLFNDWFHTRVAANHNPEPILSKIVLLR